MKRITFILFFLIPPLLSSAQKNDNVWVFGYYYGLSYPVPGLDFYWGYPDTVGFYPPFSFIASGCVSMSDDAGNLQFYTNGDEVGNWNNNIVTNSSGYNSGSGNYYNQYWQGEISIPYPDHPGKYVLFHMYGSYVGNSLFPINLYYSIIDMSLQSGEGEMTEKQINIISDTLLCCSMQATRHANGRDWWVIVHRGNSASFREILFTPYGVQQINLITTGPYLTNFDISEGQSTFSSDGSMYSIAYNTNNSIYLYDFDRCTGSISFRDSSHIVPNDPNEWPVWGCSFSPDSRYLYATTNNDLYQFDTWVSPLDSGKKLIGTYDGFLDPFQTYFFRHCPGPDGKIYLTSWGGCQHLHVINDPDLPDTLCNFVQHQLKLVSYHASTLPEFPNYRLSAINGSPCDSIYTSLAELTPKDDFLEIKNIYHNQLLIQYKITPLTNAEIIIYDMLGKRIDKLQVSSGENDFMFDASNLKPGLYVSMLYTSGLRLSSKFEIY